SGLGTVQNAAGHITGDGWARKTRSHTTKSFHLPYCRKLPANPLNHTHKRGRSREAVSLPVGDLLQKELRFRWRFLAGQCGGRSTVRYDSLYPTQFGFSIQEELRFRRRFFGRSMSGQISNKIRLSLSHELGFYLQRGGAPLPAQILAGRCPEAELQQDTIL